MPGPVKQPSYCLNPKQQAEGVPLTTQQTSNVIPWNRRKQGRISTDSCYCRCKTAVVSLSAKKIHPINIISCSTKRILIYFQNGVCSNLISTIYFGDLCSRLLCCLPNLEENLLSYCKHSDEQTSK